MNLMPPGLWRHPLQLAADALLPSACALCAARCREALCAPCHAQFLAGRRPRCRQCANPLGAADLAWPCGACLARPPPFDATVAAADYAAPLDQLVLQLKFGGVLPLAPCFGRALHAALTEDGRIALPELLCPVPLGRARLVERGFNQALEMARPLARLLGIGLHARLAERVVETAAQSSVAPSARRRNIRHAFTVAPAALALVRGRHIGVVDDVMTSGATLAELAATLKRFGAARVTCLVFARTPPH
ncbi:ComF family protein [Massilia sp. PAMC28688]|uniref:ComF family protein n=1 Tax=Massilia sp. PAMC28688 TaxID=2861283 RepID=UPI001E33A59D|nr:ComF family protein [Massilia sp. PAMC28688]